MCGQFRAGAYFRKSKRIRRGGIAFKHRILNGESCVSNHFVVNSNLVQGHSLYVALFTRPHKCASDTNCHVAGFSSELLRWCRPRDWTECYIKYTFPYSLVHRRQPGLFAMQT